MIRRDGISDPGRGRGTTIEDMTGIGRGSGGGIETDLDRTHGPNLHRAIAEGDHTVETGRVTTEDDGMTMTKGGGHTTIDGNQGEADHPGTGGVTNGRPKITICSV